MSEPVSVKRPKVSSLEGDELAQQFFELTLVSPGSLGMVADVFKSLGEPSRLQILCALRSGPKNVSEIMQITGLGQANASKHLKLLTQQNLVTRQQEGVCVYYDIASPHIFELCSIVCQLIADQVQQHNQQLKELRQLHRP
jgi:DNA-binding transcriptional ArsR family regulator